MGTSIVNVDPTGDSRTILATGQTVENGSEIEVDDELAAELLKQSEIWAPAKRSKSTPSSKNEESA